MYCMMTESKIKGIPASPNKVDAELEHKEAITFPILGNWQRGMQLGGFYTLCAAVSLPEGSVFRLEWPETALVYARSEN